MNVAQIVYNYYGGGASEFLPTDFSGLQYWYSIPMEPVVADDTLINITDFSGNGNHLTSSVNKGKYKLSALGDYPALLCEGNTYYNPTSGMNFLHEGSSTVVWIVKLTVDDETHTLFDSCNSSVTTNVGRFSRFQNYGVMVDSIGGGSGAVAGATSLSERYLKDLWLLLCQEHEASTSFNMYLDGVNQGGVQLLAPGSGNPTATPRFFMGSAGTGGFKGHFIEGFAYNRVLTDAEKLQLISSRGYGI